jgi:hypothetical protein
MALLFRGSEWQMGKEIVYCSVCGERILESDFDKGRAVTILKKNYCKKCAKDIIKANATPEGSGESKIKSPSPRRLEVRPVPPGVMRDLPPKRLSISIPFIIAIVIGILAAILLVVVISRSGPPR